MPTLQFKGKNVVWNHHLAVPYHSLEEVKGLSYRVEQADGNVIVEGDNLLGLKALLPKYTGQVRCIYIDPPYNTGSENWAYNDNVNSPLMKDWLGQVVAKDDLTRHDKWLCMMTPRLKLLHELLSEDGLIFISIDDNELSNLRQVMDEIFTEANFRNVILIRRGIKSVQAQFETVDRLNYGAEYLVVYSKSPNFRFDKFEIELEDSKPGSWNNHWRGTDRPTMRYKLLGQTPKTGQWRWGKARSLEAIDNYKRMLAELPKTKGQPTQQEIDEWFLGAVKETGEEPDLLRLSVNGKPEHYVPPTETKLASTLWSDLKPNGSSQLKALFKKKVFENPKSIDLVKRIIRFAEGKKNDTLVLDSFAGSGTTAHAALDLNSEDAGHRKYILVQMTEATTKEPKKNICKDITRQRAILATEKYSYGGGFAYFRVGSSMDPEALLAGELPAMEQLAQYVYYLCTGERAADKVTALAANLFRAGGETGNRVYLIYSQDYDELTHLALNLDFAEQIVADGPGRKVVCAPACFLDEDYLTSQQLEFVNMPYGLFERKGLEA